MDDGPHDQPVDDRACRGPESSDPKADWPTRHAGGYPPGWQVRYLCRVRGPAGGRRAGAFPEWQERTGTIAGRSLRDEHTSTTWVPVRQRDTAPDAPVNLVRATDILDAAPPAG